MFEIQTILLGGLHSSTNEKNQRNLEDSCTGSSPNVDVTTTVQKF